MVPNFEEFILPVLKELADGEARKLQDIRTATIASFNFSEEDVNELTSSGKTTKVTDRVTWALTYLRQAGLIFNPEKAVSQITEDGKLLLENPPAIITRKYLVDNYEAFRAFSKRGKKSDKAPNAKPVSAKDLTKSGNPSKKDNSTADLLKSLGEFRSAIELFKRLGTEPSKSQLKKVAELEGVLIQKLLYPKLAKQFTSDINNISESFVLSIKRENGTIAFKYDNSKETIANFPSDAELFTIESESLQTPRKRRPNWDFYNLGMIAGDEIEFIPDPSQKATIVTTKEVKYGTKTYPSLEALTQLLTNSVKRIDATALWQFEGKSLNDLYNEIFPKD
jgi:hypothetical protein